MIEPILMTSLGERLLISDPKIEYNDDKKISGSLFYHDVCHGWLDLKPISDTHNAIVCRSCHLRIPIPNSIKTFGQLREHFQATITV